MLETLLGIDENLFLKLNNLGNHNWDWLWHFITDKWSSIPLYLFLLFLLYKKTSAKAVLITLGMIVLLIFCSDQFSNVLKSGVGRLRPCQLDLPDRSIARCGKYGFPSAHAFSSMALAIFMGRILKPYYKYAFVGLIFWSLLLGFSRIYVGVHYPGDVLVGFSLGIILGTVFFKLRNLILEKLKITSEEALKIHRYFNCDELEKNQMFRLQKLLLFLSIFVVTVLYIRTEINPSTFILEDTPAEFHYEIFAIFISLIGFGLRIFTLGYHHQHPILKGKSPSSFWSAESHTTGIYSTMKYPLYVANFLIFFGPVLWTGNYWFILFFFVAYWIFYSEIIEIKEHIFKKKHGETYKNWVKNTPNFIPDFSKFKESEFLFSWKLILIKEIKMLFFLLMIYSIYNLIAKYVGNSIVELNYYLFSLCLFFGISMLIVKLLKWKTDFLEIKTDS